MVAFPVASVVLWALLRVPVLGDRLVAHPSGERWHDRPTPTFGGVGIAAGLVTGVGVALAVGAIEPSWRLAGVGAGCVIVFIAGLIDDARSLSPRIKLAAQVAAAALAIGGGLRVDLIGSEVVGAAIALIWLVGITNAFNLLDNMDGLAASLATVAAAYFAIDAVTEHPNDLVLVLALALGAACLGFLPLNLRPGRPASVFMGDAGSQLLGFLLAVLGLAASWTTAGTTVATTLLPLLVLAVPILDTTLVTVRRLAERRPVSQGGKDHSSHRLVYYGLSESRAVLLLSLIAVVLGATAVAYNVLGRPQVTAIGVLATFVLLVQFGQFLSELDDDRRAGRPGDTSLRRAFAIDPRRAVEVVLDGLATGGVLLAAYVLAVGGHGGVAERGAFLGVLPVLLGSRYVGLVAFRVYRRAWRYANTRDVAVLLVALVVAEAATVGIVVATLDLGDLPLWVFALDLALVAPCLVVLRLAQRLAPNRATGRRRVLVAGAGPEGRVAARDLRNAGVTVIGFLDEDPRLQRRRVAGIPVVGTLAETEAIATALGADDVVRPRVETRSAGIE